MITFKRLWVFFVTGIISFFSFIQAATFTITVNAGSKTGSWNRFYERAVASDHIYTVINSAYGRNISNALKKAHNEAGFQYIRGHGILDDDVAVYSEDAGGNAVYSWTNFDKIYDSVTAAGMRPVVEIGFMPTALASTPVTRINSVWYNNIGGNSNAPKDWNKWKALVSALISHVETRYGAAEVRNNWYFELWNEPNWMYGAGGGDNGYLRLYDSTAVAITATDPLVKLGGPAENGGTSAGFIATLITHCRSNNKKLDFVTYHRYSNDYDATGNHDNDAVSLNNFHKTIVDVYRANNFTGSLLCTEWGSSYSQGRAHHDNEQAASFIAKVVCLLNSNDTTTYPPPYMYGWWAISDIYEETNNSGSSSAFPGCYGLLTRGTSSITQSWDVAKPAFNAYKLLHKLGAYKLSCTGGTTASPGVNAVATISAASDTVSVLVYSQVDNTTGNSATTDDISLTISGIPSAGTTARMEHWVVDRTHSNSYQTWVGLTSPANPTATQWTTIANAAQLAHYDSAATVTLGGSEGAATYTKLFTQNYYSVGLIQLTNYRGTSVSMPETNKERKEVAFVKSNMSIVGKSILLSLPYSGHYTINLYATSGRKELNLHAVGPMSGSIALGKVPAGAYLLECSGPAQKIVKTVIVGK